MWTDYLKAFLVGGALCALGQVLIDRTKLTPARILTCYVVLGVVLLNTQYSFGFVQSVVYGVFGGLGFMLAICLFASVREKLEFADYPESFEGFPICLVSAGLLALAFMGFSGMKIG